MAPAQTPVVRVDDASTSSDGVEAPRDSATSRLTGAQSSELKPQASGFTFVDTRTGKEIDVDQTFPGVPHEELPEHVKKHHRHLTLDNIGDRFGERTHAGVKAKHQRAVKVLGRIGWVAKGIVYALIGGLCCRGAISEDLNVDASPQGAFVLIGKGVAGIYILIIMAVALATYIIWRFWEGITAQGSHECYSKFQNFFRFRLSPLVSGFVYTAYLVYILTLLPKAFDYHNDAVAKTEGSDFTKSWSSSGIGRFGLVLVGFAFLIATIVMLQGALTKKFHRELRLKESRWGRSLLFIIGFGLIVYGLFACLNAYPAKIFPTPLPSQEEMDKMIKAREEKAKLKAEAKERAKVLKDSKVPTAISSGDAGKQPTIAPLAQAV